MDVYDDVAIEMYGQKITSKTTLTLNVTEIHPLTYGQGQGYVFLGHQY